MSATTKTTNVTFTFDFDHNEEKAPLFHQYPGEFAPQPAFISLDPENWEAGADWSGEVGNAVPARVWHNLELRWPVPANVRGAALVEFCEQHADLFARVCDGFEKSWDGNNWVGRYSSDAQDAQEKLERLIELELSNEIISVSSVAEYCADMQLAEVWPEGLTLDQAAEKLWAEIKEEEPDDWEIQGSVDAARDLILDICDRERGELPARLEPELKTVEDWAFDPEDFLSE